MNNVSVTIECYRLWGFTDRDHQQRKGLEVGLDFSGPLKSSQDKRASMVAQMVKNLPAMQETRVQSLSWGDPLEEGMATHSSILAWRSQWTEEPDGLQSIGSQRVGHDWATNTFTLQDRGPCELRSMEMDRGACEQEWGWQSEWSR